MSDKGSVFQKGGGGTNFEQAIQTAFLTTLIIRGNSPCVYANEIIEVAFQTTNRGCETDDLLIVAKSAIGQHRLLVQIKHNITFTADNDIFKEVIRAFWKDYNNPIFDKEKDKLLIIKSGFTKDERNHLKSLLNWAKTHATEADFVTEVNRIKGKKDRLEVFRESLKEVNNNTALTNKEIWEFLKCFDVLEYDFTNQNSVDEIYFLNLIKLCKNKETTSNEKEIWDVLFSFVSKLNKDGGSVTTDSIQKEELYKYFDTKKLNPYFKAIDKLRSDSEAILSPIKNSIGEFHLDRKNINQSIIDSVNNFQFTIVTGKPGVGKSAEIKDVLKTEFSSASIFVFRADQFNEPHIANVFSSQGVNETIQDIFSCISLIPDKIIFIDSLEKLLEADPECAFKQLLALLKEFPDIKIIGSSRKYAVDLITQKFGIDKKELGNAEVLPLNDNELDVIAGKFPQLKNVLKNEKIKKLLQSPKYLDFAILAVNKSNDDYTNISLTEFKDKLWNSLVVDSTNIKNGLPIKRENAFMEIAVNRAKEMKLFTKPIKADAEAIVLLENDEILFQENQNRKYSPTHDVLEDWALVKYVSSKYEEYPNPKDFFDNIGNESAIRRAFRLWIEDFLIDDNEKVNHLINATLDETNIERYWADELLIAVFKSDTSKSFFEIFNYRLINNDGIFLNRCIHLIRTSCKESNLSNNDSSILIPTGSGWKEIILYINSHISKLDILRLSILNLLYDWEFRLIFQLDVDEQETLSVKDIVLYYINQIEKEDEFWQEEFTRGKRKNLITLLYNLSQVAKSEITTLIERASKNKEKHDNWRLNSFYDMVLEACLSGLNTYRIGKELPQLIIDTAWKEWKLKYRKKDLEEGNIESMLYDSHINNEKRWGIEDKQAFFPPGIYKTPIYNIIVYHPLIGLEFIVDFINYSVDFYFKTESEYKLALIQIEIELNDGAKIKQWGCGELWVAYRDYMSVTHYAIESLLMSLEKFLLEVARRKTELSKANLKYMFDFILRRSNNVATTSVLVSVAIAYPNEVEEFLMPLLSVREFYHWDMSRATNENLVSLMNDDEISFAIEERIKSKNLIHRKKYPRGLIDFIIDYQFNNRILNNDIHKLFDKLYPLANKEDIIWKKILNEIDIRKWEVTEDKNVENRFLVQPKYDEDVKKFLESGQEEFKAQGITLNYSSIVSKAYDEKEQMTFEIWLKCYNHYLDDKKLDKLFDRPVSLAILGLKEFHFDIDNNQKVWCINKIVETISLILQDIKERNFSLNRNYNLMEKEIALKGFHYVVKNLDSDEDKNKMIALMIDTLSAHFHDHEIKKITEYFRLVLFKECPDEAKRVWYGLIIYSRLKKENSKKFFRYDENEIIKLQEIKEDFINELSNTKDFNLDINKINLSDYDAYLLSRVFIITPYNTYATFYQDFILNFLSLLVEDLKLEDNYSYNKIDKRQIHYAAILDIKFYCAELLLNAEYDLSKEVLDLVLNPIYDRGITFGRRGKDDLFDFAAKVPEYLIIKLNTAIANSNNEDLNENLIMNFWKVWKYLFEKIKNSGKLFFTKILFLDIDWGSEVQHWKPLENEKEFYFKMISELGISNAKHIINVFSTIGEKSFLPQGITLIVNILKKNPTEEMFLISSSGERLIKRLFYNHITVIKNSKTLIEDFIWILNKMVDLGSSEAYLFRENVITYKQVIN